MWCQHTGAWSRYYAGVATTRICQPALTDPETRYATIKKNGTSNTHQHPPSTERLMGKWRQLSSLTNVSATRLLRAVTISTWGFLPSAKFWPSGRRGDKVAPGAWPKAWPKAKPYNFLRYILPSAVEHKKNQSRFFTRATPLVATKMVNFVSKRNSRYTSLIPFLTILTFFLPPPSESVRSVGVRSYPDVITKFSQIRRFPMFFSHEAPLARGGSAIIAKVQINTPYTLTRQTCEAKGFSRVTKNSRNRNFLLWRGGDICS